MGLGEILNLERLTEVVDVGANPIDGDPPYKSMLDSGLCRVTGFEPQKDALDTLRLKAGPLELYLPYAVGDGQRHELRVCRASGMTSLLEPNSHTLSLFEVLKPLGEVIERVQFQTVRLYEVEEIKNLDFLKIDIQGGELNVFRGGERKLLNAVAVQTEVSFLNLYHDQPSIGEIDVELRRQGFIPHCFAEIKRWPIAPCVIDNNPRKALNQLLEADLVYVKDFTQLDGFGDEQLKHLVMIAHYCYKSYDLCLRLIIELQERKKLPAPTQSRYLALLSGGANV